MILLIQDNAPTFDALEQAYQDGYDDGMMNAFKLMEDELNNLEMGRLKQEKVSNWDSMENDDIDWMFEQEPRYTR